MLLYLIIKKKLCVNIYFLLEKDKILIKIKLTQIVLYYYIKDSCVNSISTFWWLNWSLYLEITIRILKNRFHIQFSLEKKEIVNRKSNLSEFYLKDACVNWIFYFRWLNFIFFVEITIRVSKKRFDNQISLEKKIKS